MTDENTQAAHAEFLTAKGFTQKETIQGTYKFEYIRKDRHIEKVGVYRDGNWYATTETPTGQRINVVRGTNSSKLLRERFEWMATTGAPNR